MKDNFKTLNITNINDIKEVESYFEKIKEKLEKYKNYYNNKDKYSKCCDEDKLENIELNFNIKKFLKKNLKPKILNFTQDDIDLGIGDYEFEVFLNEDKKIKNLKLNKPEDNIFINKIKVSGNNTNQVEFQFQNNKNENFKDSKLNENKNFIYNSSEKIYVEMKTPFLIDREIQKFEENIKDIKDKILNLNSGQLPLEIGDFELEIVFEDYEKKDVIESVKLTGNEIIQNDNITSPSKALKLKYRKNGDQIKIKKNDSKQSEINFVYKHEDRELKISHNGIYLFDKFVNRKERSYTGKDLYTEVKINNYDLELGIGNYEIIIYGSKDKIDNVIFNGLTTSYFQLNNFNDEKLILQNINNGHEITIEIKYNKSNKLIELQTNFKIKADISQPTKITEDAMRNVLIYPNSQYNPIEHGGYELNKKTEEIGTCVLKNLEYRNQEYKALIKSSTNLDKILKSRIEIAKNHYETYIRKVEDQNQKFKILLKNTLIIIF